MKDHKNRDINQTITDILLCCLEHPISVYVDLHEKQVSTSDTEKEARWMWKNPRYEWVMEVDKWTQAGIIRNKLLDKLEEGKDFPIQTSLQKVIHNDTTD